MKFAKELQRKSLPKWKAHYTRYKDLKKILAVLTPASHDNASVHSLGSGGSGGGSSSGGPRAAGSGDGGTVPTPAGAPAPHAPASRAKSRSSGDRSPLKSQADADGDELHVSVDSAAAQPPPATSALVAAAAAVVASRAEALALRVRSVSRQFFESLQTDLDGINAFVAGAQASMATERERLEALRQELVALHAGAAGTALARRTLLAQERRLWETDNELRDFAELNYQAFFKATKKHDKVTGLSTLESVMRCVDSQPFVRELGLAPSSVSGASPVHSQRLLEAAGLEPLSATSGPTSGLLIPTGAAASSLASGLVMNVGDGEGDEDDDDAQSVDSREGEPEGDAGFVFDAEPSYGGLEAIAEAPAKHTGEGGGGEEDEEDGGGSGGADADTADGAVGLPLDSESKYTLRLDTLSAQQLAALLREHVGAGATSPPAVPIPAGPGDGLGGSRSGSVTPAQRAGLLRSIGLEGQPEAAGGAASPPPSVTGKPMARHESGGASALPSLDGTRSRARSTISSNTFLRAPTPATGVPAVSTASFASVPAPPLATSSSSASRRASQADLEPKPPYLRPPPELDWNGRDPAAFATILQQLDEALLHSYSLAEGALRVMAPESTDSERLKRLARFTAALLRAQRHARLRAADPRTSLRSLHDLILALKVELLRGLLALLVRQVTITSPEDAAALEHVLQAHWTLLGMYMRGGLSKPKHAAIDLFAGLVGGARGLSGPSVTSLRALAGRSGHDAEEEADGEASGDDGDNSSVDRAVPRSPRAIDRFESIGQQHRTALHLPTSQTSLSASVSAPRHARPPRQPPRRRADSSSSDEVATPGLHTARAKARSLPNTGLVAAKPRSAEETGAGADAGAGSPTAVVAAVITAAEHEAEAAAQVVAAAAAAVSTSRWWRRQALFALGLVGAEDDGSGEADEAMLGLNASGIDALLREPLISPLGLLAALWRRWRPPFFEWVGDYRVAKYLQRDVIAGITSGIVLVPQGLAYATLAGLPPVYGLYTGLPGAIYAIFGTSHHAAVGPMSIPALLIAAGVSGMSNPPQTPADYAAAVFLVSLLSGIILLAMGWLHLGFVVRFISRPVLSGFTTAAAILTMCSSVRDMIGVSSMPRPQVLQDFFAALPEALPQTRPLTIVVALVALALLILLPNVPRLKAIPPPLIVVALFTAGAAAVMAATGDDGGRAAGGPAQTRSGVALVGAVSGALPVPKVPVFTAAAVVELLPTAVSVMFVGLIEAIAVAKLYALKHGYEIYPESELKALGATNVFGSFFQSFPVMGAFGRSAINEAAGAHSQIAGLVSALTVALLLLFVLPAIFFLPKPVLAALIVGAVRNLVDISELRRLWAVDKRDCLIGIAALLATLVLGVLTGVLTAMGFSLLMFLASTTQPHIEELGRLQGTVIFRHLGLVGAVKVPGLKIIRFNAPLFFANCSVLRERLLLELSRRRSLPPRLQWRALILCFSAVSQIDSTSIQALDEVLHECKIQRVPLLIASPNAFVEASLSVSGFTQRLGGPRMQFRRVHEAVRAVLMQVVTEKDLPTVPDKVVEAVAAAAAAGATTPLDAVPPSATSAGGVGRLVARAVAAARGALGSGVRNG